MVRVSPRRIIKGPCKITELEAVEYVAAHTTIPVPKIHATYSYRGALFIEMEYVPGENLEQACLEGSVSGEEIMVIIGQLGDYIRQMRGLKMPPVGAKEQRGRGRSRDKNGVGNSNGEGGDYSKFVGSANMNECVDYRIGPEAVGPFANHKEFHSFLRGKISVEDCAKIFGEVVADVHSGDYRSCFTHGDLCPRNIIIGTGEEEDGELFGGSHQGESHGDASHGDNRKTRRIVSILDWESAGWFPEYWEYTKAHYGVGQGALPDWYEKYGFADIHGYKRELAAEQVLWEMFDRPARHEA